MGKICMICLKSFIITFTLVLGFLVVFTDVVFSKTVYVDNKPKQDANIDYNYKNREKAKQNTSKDIMKRKLQFNQCIEQTGSRSYCQYLFYAK